MKVKMGHDQQMMPGRLSESSLKDGEGQGEVEYKVHDASGRPGSMLQPYLRSPSKKVVVIGTTLFIFYLLFYLTSSSTIQPKTSLVCSRVALPTPTLRGGSIKSVTAIQIANFTYQDMSTSFCNVSITYTHPGQNDLINVWVWLPSNWNGRFQGVGGSGYDAGMEIPDMVTAVSKGYTAVTTDAGHFQNYSATHWAFISPGTLTCKQITEAFYGKPIKKSYWNGCSTGGRQGLMKAQRYPDAYNGILATAPAINWAEFLPAEFWPQRVMHEADYIPSQCELEAINQAAIEACDELDGLRDGVIGKAGLCNFKTESVIEQPYSCPCQRCNITAKAAAIAQSIWDGPRDSFGRFQWYGVAQWSPFSGLADTVCDSEGTCTGLPFYISTQWHQYFIQKDLSFDVFNMTHVEWDTALRTSRQQYQSIIGTSDPDLTDFKRFGGKMITWHGTYDPLIPFNGTVNYYERVLEVDANAADYYRFFAAPGVGHCADGVGPIPTGDLEVLVAWVEDGVVPQTLPANRKVNSKRWEQELCLYPLVSGYKGGDPSEASSFRCE